MPWCVLAMLLATGPAASAPVPSPAEAIARAPIPPPRMPLRLRSRDRWQGVYVGDESGVWTEFLTLHDGSVGRLSLAGSSTGRAASCTASTNAQCLPFAEAAIGLGWRRHGSLVLWFLGLALDGNLAAIAAGNKERYMPRLTAGVSIKIPRLIRR